MTYDFHVGAGKGFKHGFHGTPEYRSWTEMNKRCNCATSSRFSYYGGRGISICKRWKSFPAFLEDMGEKPSAAHSLDRIDPNGNYEPSNCRWASKAEQSRNRRIPLLTVMYNGRPIPAVEFYELEPRPVTYEKFRHRIRAGWAIEMALLNKPLPRGKRGAKYRGNA